VLFVFAMRPDWNTPGWQLYMETQIEYSEYSAAIYLEPLTSTDSRALVHELLEDANVPDRVYELIERKAEGNPYFVEETVRTLLDSGALHREAAGFRWDQSTDVEQITNLIGLPGNVQALLTARIDQLNPDVRRTMQLAAVIGRSFPLRVLERISERPSEVLNEHLKRLAQADLVRPSLSGAESEYAFRHALTRDAAYETILIRQRRRYHRRVAEAFEALYVDRLNDEAPQLAYHFNEARDWAKAIHFYTLAGEAAARLYANAEAIEHYRRALTIALDSPTAADDATLIELYRSMARVYAVAGEHDKSLAVADEMLAGVDTSKRNALRAEILTAKGKALAALGRVEDARAVWLEALGEARRQGAPRAEWPPLVALHDNEPDPAMQARYLREATEVIDFIAAHLEEPELRAAFLALPDVSRVMAADTDE